MAFSKSKFLTIFLLFCTLLHLGFANEEAMDNPIAQSEIGQRLPYAQDCCNSCHSGTCCSGSDYGNPPYGCGGCMENPPKCCSSSICHPSPPSCQGQCQGPCQGQCQGPCQGQCQGPSQGQCQGPCQGQCQGPCQGQCQGPCQSCGCGRGNVRVEGQHESNSNHPSSESMSPKNDGN